MVSLLPHAEEVERDASVHHLQNARTVTEAHDLSVPLASAHGLGERTGPSVVRVVDGDDLL